MSNEFKVHLLAITTVLVFFIVVVPVTVKFFDLTFFNNIPVKVVVDGKKVYEGKNGCITTTSAGTATKVVINGGFLCFFPKQRFTSKNVEVITVGEQL
jgi:uncharacterized membrane protein YqiK